MARDVSFFDQLGSLLSKEREAEKARLATLAEGLSLHEREEQGLSVLDLETVEEAVGLGGRVLLTLARADRARLPSRLHNGDLVAVFPRRAEVSEPAKALISRASATRLQLAADDFFLVHGPPGTGKSTVLAEVAAQAVARGQRLLCTAASNAAVDHLLDLCLAQGLRAIRVGHPARVAARLQEHTLDIVVEEHPDRI